MASDVMRVRLHLRQVRVLAVVVDTPEELRVRVESTVSRPRCPHCGFKCYRVHDIREREVRDLEVSGRPVTLVWMRRRMVCGSCASRWLEEHPGFDGRLTRRLAHRLVADAQVMTIEHRSSAALSVFLMSQPHRWRRGVKVVVTDGSRAYKASVDACLPHARHMLDRFGVIRWFCAGLTAVRRDIQRRQPDLRADIDRLRRVTTTQAVPVPSPERGSTESLRQRLVAALDEITRLNADNHQIRVHLAQQLGHQRHNRIPDPSTTCLPHETQAPNHHSAKPSR